MNTPTPSAHAERPTDPLGRDLNPDTGLLMPSPSTEQLALVEELCADLGRSRDPEDTVRQALLRAVVRQQGRTLRACSSRLRTTAEQYEAEARSYAEVGAERYASGEPAAAASALEHAASVALRARALRSVAL